MFGGDHRLHDCGACEAGGCEAPAARDGMKARKQISSRPDMEVGVEAGCGLIKVIHVCRSFPLVQFGGVNFGADSFKAFRLFRGKGAGCHDAQQKRMLPPRQESLAAFQQVAGFH